MCRGMSGYSTEKMPAIIGNVVDRGLHLFIFTKRLDPITCIRLHRNVSLLSDREKDMTCLTCKYYSMLS